MRSKLLSAFLLVLISLVANAQTGLLGSYPFNGNANDASGNGNNGTINGATLTVDRHGNPSSAYLFNGTSYVDIGNNFSYNSHSFACWARRDSALGNVLVSKINNGPYDLQNSELKIDGFSVGNGTTWEEIITTAPVDHKQWNCYVATYDSVTNVAKLYINGFMDSLVVGPYADVANIPVYIGARPYWTGTTGPAFFFRGSIDDVRLYNRVVTTREMDSLCSRALISTVSFCDGDSVQLTASGGNSYQWNTGVNTNSIFAKTSGTYSVTVSYASGFSVTLSKTVAITPANVTNGLIASYPFNGTPNDTSGNSYDGINNGATLTTDRFGIPNSAYSFNGSSNYIDVNDATPLRLNNTDYTLSFWTVVDSHNTTGTAFIYKRGFGNQTGWALGADGGTQNQLHLITSEGIDPRGYSASSLSEGDWHHVAVVYSLSSKQLQFYIDGALDNTTTGVDHNFIPINGMPSPDANNNSVMRFGQDSKNAAYWLNGKLDDIKIYNRALSTCDIDSLYREVPCSYGTVSVSTQDSISCFGDDDGAAIVNVNGGIAPYDYRWSNGATTSSVADLTAGDYTVTVTDSLGCTVTASVQIQDGYQIIAGNISGNDTADINETATYDVNAGYAYTWNITNGTITSGQGTNSIEADWDSTGQGTVLVIVTDQGCADTVMQTITLIDPTGISRIFESKVELYPNPATGTITVKSVNMRTAASLKLHDSLGKEVMQQNAEVNAMQNGILMDISHLKNGIYFLSIKSEGATSILKVVKY